MGLIWGQPFLAVHGLLAHFAKRRAVARARYAQIIAEGIKVPSPWQSLKGQVFLGDERFREKIQARTGEQRRDDMQIPIAHRRALAPTLSQIEQPSPDLNTAIVAYRLSIRWRSSGNV